MSADPPLAFLAKTLRAVAELVRRLSLWDDEREAAVRQRDAVGEAWYAAETAVLVQGASAAAVAGLEAGEALELMQNVRLRMAQLLTCDGYYSQNSDGLHHDAESLALVLDQLQAMTAPTKGRGRKPANPSAPNPCDRAILKRLNRAVPMTGQQMADLIGYDPDYVRARLAGLIKAGKVRRAGSGYVPAK